MAELAGWLSPILQKPVFDMKSLEGKYDLDVELVQSAGDTPEYAASQAVAKSGSS
jgi:uncharacterized protein (TIGR03435 family)